LEEGYIKELTLLGTKLRRGTHMVNIKKKKYTLNPFRVAVSPYLGEDGCFARRDNKRLSSTRSPGAKTSDD
jgi:hypothetical protein